MLAIPNEKTGFLCENQEEQHLHGMFRLAELDIELDDSPQQVVASGLGLQQQAGSPKIQI